MDNPDRRAPWPDSVLVTLIRRTLSGMVHRSYVAVPHLLKRQEDGSPEQSDRLIEPREVIKGHRDEEAARERRRRVIGNHGPEVLLCDARTLRPVAA
jgi:hypothetical protein